MATAVYKVGNDVSTDEFFPGRFMAAVLPSDTPQFALADDAAFNDGLKVKQIPPGKVVIVGAIGCNSSRKQAISFSKVAI